MPKILVIVKDRDCLAVVLRAFLKLISEFNRGGYSICAELHIDKGETARKQRGRLGFVSFLWVYLGKEACEYERRAIMTGACGLTGAQVI